MIVREDVKPLSREELASFAAWYAKSARDPKADDAIVRLIRTAELGVEWSELVKSRWL